ncbi:M23 family metallopeptidase [Salimicrobium humidisoli]|uniref:Peptidase M23 n=1 Tax=Salimicrobium humidisoli TaxID=2029857 RepID=A0ABX4HNM3_9BACI|nr:M23 family metallopeptidase [Salimicrobium humidisoli]PBB04648.1 peptidase M23 [Salimicrobium humidisoli]
MTLTIIQLTIFQFILPAFFIFTLLKGKFKGKMDWALQALTFTTYISWVFFFGRWDWTIYYVRFLWPLLLIIVLYISWRKVRLQHPPKSYAWKDKTGFTFYILLTAIFVFYHIQIFSGYSTNEEAIELAFPLDNGTYYVGQGGASTQINQHHANLEQQYALDIVQLNPLGVRSTGIYPAELDRYKIYGAELVSPCSGKIVGARTDMTDLNPPEANPEQPRGNYVQIKCERNEANVLIAHMQEDSATVKAGDKVKTGEPIGLVGNSGNTSEPHLHIHAEESGEGVPIEFNGRFLVRNSLIWE